MPPLKMRMVDSRNGSGIERIIAAMIRGQLNSRAFAVLFAVCFMQVTRPAIATGAAMTSGYDEKSTTVAANATVVAKAYPNKLVRLIEPFGAGGGPDLLARALSPKLAELWGTPVTVENHPGAGSTVAPAHWSQIRQPTVTRCS